MIRLAVVSVCVVKQQLDSSRTTWHITVGTYGTRLHGGVRPTVDRGHNARGEPFIDLDPEREGSARAKMRGDPVLLTSEQRVFVEAIVPTICQRGGWKYRICAAPGPPENTHVHVLCDADRFRHGKQIRLWLKRWLTKAMDARWGRPTGGSWWVQDGSTKPVTDEAYLNNVYEYIQCQRTTICMQD